MNNKQEQVKSAEEIFDAHYEIFLIEHPDTYFTLAQAKEDPMYAMTVNAMQAYADQQTESLRRNYDFAHDLVIRQTKTINNLKEAIVELRDSDFENEESRTQYANDVLSGEFDASQQPTVPDWKEAFRKFIVCEFASLSCIPDKDFFARQLSDYIETHILNNPNSDTAGKQTG
jgi:DNA primase large subunit